MFLIISASISSQIIAQNLDEPKSEFKQAIGVCPIGLVQGDIFIT